MCSAGEVLGLLHDGAERTVGQVLGSDESEHGAGQHAVKGDLAALDRLVERKRKATRLVCGLYDRLALTEIALMLSQFTGTILNDLRPSCRKKLHG